LEAASAQGAFFPLAIGNRWHAVAVDRYRVEPTTGSPYDDFTIYTTYLRELIDTEELSGRSYVVMKEAWSQNDPLSGEPWTGTYWTRYRQDGSGLYEADAALTTPPDAPSALVSSSSLALVARRETPIDALPGGGLPEFRAAWETIRQRAALVHTAVSKATTAGPPGGLVSGEITRLVYPLHPGRSWEIRPDPLFSSVVEGVEYLNLPAGRFPAYRIRIDSEFIGPGDVVYLWMGRSGQLAVRYHFESEVRDALGNVVGRAVDDYNEVLHEVSLVAPR
jgi:hypothetical protein